jgi:hypothetical protein
MGTGDDGGVPAAPTTAPVRFAALVAALSLVSEMAE